MLVKWFGMFVLCVAIGLAIAVAPELLSAEDKATRQVSPADHRRLVRACVNEAEQKLKAMGPFFGWDPDEVRRKCARAVDARVHVPD